ncbi:MAG: tetratricopeptide repeat protein [Planctomycetota bacterium]|nr:tetratricopeptide repeat protein [Planctomycetota bacterium]
MSVRGVNSLGKQAIGALVLFMGLSIVGVCDAQEQDGPKGPNKPPSKACQACLRPSATSKHGDIRSHELAHESLSAKIAKAEDPHESRMLRGKLYLKLTLYGKARDDFETAIKLKRDLFDAYLGRGKAFAGLGDVKKALDDLTEAIGCNAAKSSGYRERARVSRAHGDFRGAERDLRTSRARDKKDNVSLKELATVLEEMNKFEDAKKHYTELSKSGSPDQVAYAWMALKRLGTLSKKPYTKSQPFKKLDEANAELLISRAQLYFQLKELAKAKADLSTALIQLRSEAKMRSHFRSWSEAKKHVLCGSEQRFRQALSLMVLVRLQLGEDNDEVQRELKELERRAPKSSETALAQSCFSKTRKSLDNYSQRLKDDTSLFASAFRNAQMIPSSPHDFRSRYRGTFANHCFALDRLLYLNPWNYQARFERAKLYFQGKHELPQLSRDLKSILVLQPSHWKARLFWARVLQKTGSEASLKSASEQLSIVLEQMKKFKGVKADKNVAMAEVYFRRAMISRREALAKYTRSAANTCLADLRIAIQRSPRDTARGLNLIIQCYSARSKRHAELGNSEDQLSDMKSVELCRKDAKEEALKYLAAGMKARDRREYKESIDLFNRSLDYDARNAEVFYARSISYLKIGNFAPAILGMSKAVELDESYGRSFSNKMYQVSYVVDLKRVVVELDPFILQYSESAHVWFLRGIVQLARTAGKANDEAVLASAERDLNRAVELNPNFVSAQEARCLILIRRGKLAEAEKALDKTLKLSPDSGEVRILRAVLVAKSVSQLTNEVHRAAAVARGRAILKKALQDRPLMANRAGKNKELLFLFDNVSELKAFIRLHSAGR